MNPWGLFIVAAGIFSVVCAAFDWEWFMNHPKARFMSMLLSRNGARIFYIILGIGLAVFGILITAGIVVDKAG